MKSLDRHIHHYYNSILIGHQSAGGETAFTVEPELLRSGLQRFPKLLSALLPPDADTSRFDINVYQLLRVSGEWAGWTMMDGQTDRHKTDRNRLIDQCLPTGEGA